MQCITRLARGSDQSGAPPTLSANSLSLLRGLPSFARGPTACAMGCTSFAASRLALEQSELQGSEECQQGFLICRFQFEKALADFFSFVSVTPYCIV